MSAQPFNAYALGYIHANYFFLKGIGFTRCGNKTVMDAYFHHLSVTVFG